jgi:hypothetical protein
MEEREQDQQEERDEQTSDDVAREIEEDPSTAGPPEEPGDELRGG